MLSFDQTNAFYRQFMHDKYSQNGEDGVLEKLLEQLNIHHGLCCEFGAVDGVHLSNTFKLVENGWKAVYIECNPVHFDDLKNLEKSYPILSLTKKVEIRGENSLDNLLAQTFLCEDFDILVIDVDGPDNLIWRSLINYKPKIVMIEIAAKYTTEDVEQIELPSYRHDSPYFDLVTGTSLVAMSKIAQDKGYTPIMNTFGNLIAVRNDYVHLLKIK